MTARIRQTEKPLASSNLDRICHQRRRSEQLVPPLFRGENLGERFTRQDVVVVGADFVKSTALLGEFTKQLGSNAAAGEKLTGLVNKFMGTVMHVAGEFNGTPISLEGDKVVFIFTGAERKKKC